MESRALSTMLREMLGSLDPFAPASLSPFLPPAPTRLTSTRSTSTSFGADPAPTDPAPESDEGTATEGTTTAEEGTTTSSGTPAPGGNEDSTDAHSAEDFKAQMQVFLGKVKDSESMCRQAAGYVERNSNALQALVTRINDAKTALMAEKDQVVAERDAWKKEIEAANAVAPPAQAQGGAPAAGQPSAPADGESVE